MLPSTIDRQVEVQSVLSQLVSQGECLQMTTNYKGITLSQKITHAFFDEESIQINPLRQVCCNKPGQRIYIHHNSLPRAVATTISAIDMIAGTITVSHFDFSDHPFQSRKGDRVQPGRPIRAILTFSHSTVSTCLLDLSEEGLGAIYYQAFHKDLTIQPGLAVRVGMRMPNILQPIFLSGVVNRSRQVGKSTMMSIGIHFTPNEKNTSQLKKYLKTRHAEILDEISNSIELVMEPNQTKDLYF